MSRGRENWIEITFKANTVLPPLSLHLVTAPPAPSPRLPSSSIRFSTLAIRQPSSSSSSASNFRTFSKVMASIAPSSPCRLSCRDMSTPPSLAFENIDPVELCGSGVPCDFAPPTPYCDTNDKFEYCDPAEVGLLPRPPKLSVRLCASLLPLALWPCCTLTSSCGAPREPRRGLRVSFGRVGLEEGAASWGGCCWPAVPPTAFALGEGGIARPSRGVRAPPPRAPGMAGRRRGAGAFIMGTGLEDCIVAGMS